MSPLGLLGRGSTYDFLRVDSRRARRCGVGVGGKGSSQYGQRVDGSIDGSRKTLGRLFTAEEDIGRTYMNHRLVKYQRGSIVP